MRSFTLLHYFCFTCDVIRLKVSCFAANNGARFLHSKKLTRQDEVDGVSTSASPLLTASVPSFTVPVELRPLPLLSGVRLQENDPRRLGEV